MNYVRDNYGSIEDKIEPNVPFVDYGAFYASMTISLKRIADALEGKKEAIKTEPEDFDLPGAVKYVYKGKSYYRYQSDWYAYYKGHWVSHETLPYPEIAEAADAYQYCVHGISKVETEQDFETVNKVEQGYEPSMHVKPVQTAEAALLECINKRINDGIDTGRVGILVLHDASRLGIVIRWADNRSPDTEPKVSSG